MPAGVSTSLHGLWTMGFGQVQTTALVQTGRALNLTSNILLANLPQLVLSILYLSYNSIYTCQLVAYEWSQFSRHRKRLRVTRPSQGQISTYYLGLPYSYGIPLLIISILLHWMFSRSIFLVNIKFVDYLGRSGSDPGVVHFNIDITECGYSPIAIIFSIIVSCIVLLVGISNGFRRYDPGIRLARTCSTAISAACHPNPEEIPDLAFEPLQWGVISYKDGVGHCSFSSRLVGPPTMYDPDSGRADQDGHS